jgi:hypothetical protein
MIKERRKWLECKEERKDCGGELIKNVRKRRQKK